MIFFALNTFIVLQDVIYNINYIRKCELIQSVTPSDGGISVHIG